MEKKKILPFLGVLGALSQETLLSDYVLHPVPKIKYDTNRYKEYKKSPLTKKQNKRRKANKRARQSRKQNRRK